MAQNNPPPTTSIKTYVILDLELSGPLGQSARIREIAFYAIVKEDFLGDTALSPKTVPKLVLYLNPEGKVLTTPNRRTQRTSYQSALTLDKVKLINAFLKSFPQPICLIAHNGIRFDFKLIRHELALLNASLLPNLLCGDSYPFFVEVEKTPKKTAVTPPSTSTITTAPPVRSTARNLFDHGFLPSSLVKSMSALTVQPPTVPPSTTLRRTRSASAGTRKVTTALQTTNEKLSYKLENIYKRLFGRSFADAHRAEDDCEALLMCLKRFGVQFSAWIDHNNKPF